MFHAQALGQHQSMIVHLKTSKSHLAEQNQHSATIFGSKSILQTTWSICTRTFYIDNSRTICIQTLAGESSADADSRAPGVD